MLTGKYGRDKLTDFGLAGNLPNRGGDAEGAGSDGQVRENVASLDIELSAKQQAGLDAVGAPPPPIRTSSSSCRANGSSADTT